MSFFQSEKSKLSGVNMMLIALIIGAEKREKPSGNSFARLLGVISPKIRTRTVVAMVERVDARFWSPLHHSMNTTVASEEASMFTMLLPISMVVSNLS